MKKRQKNVKKKVEEHSERRNRRIRTTRYDPDPAEGLSSQQVQEHRMHGVDQHLGGSACQDDKGDHT